MALNIPMQGQRMKRVVRVEHPVVSLAIPRVSYRMNASQKQGNSRHKNPPPGQSGDVDLKGTMRYTLAKMSLHSKQKNPYLDKAAT
jgi:hypothetical protein